MGAWLQSHRAEGETPSGQPARCRRYWTSEAIGKLWPLLFLFTRVVPVIPNHLIYWGIVFEALVNKTVRVVRRLSLLQFVLGERMKSESDGSVGCDSPRHETVDMVF